jgi:hypothetical protein
MPHTFSVVSLVLCLGSFIALTAPEVLPSVDISQLVAAAAAAAVVVVVVVVVVCIYLFIYLLPLLFTFFSQVPSLSYR